MEYIEKHKDKYFKVSIYLNRKILLNMYHLVCILVFNNLFSIYPFLI